MWRNIFLPISFCHSRKVPFKMADVQGSGVVEGSSGGSAPLLKFREILRGSAPPPNTSQ